MEIMFTAQAHPTLSESLLDAYGAVERMAINGLSCVLAVDFKAFRSCGLLPWESGRLS